MAPMSGKDISDANSIKKLKDLFEAPRNHALLSKYFSECRVLNDLRSFILVVEMTFNSLFVQ